MVELHALASDIHRDFASLQSLDDVKAFRIKYFGRKGLVTQALRTVGSLREEDRISQGSKLNELRASIEEKLTTREKKIKKDVREKTLAMNHSDVTLPGKAFHSGSSHPLTQALDEIITIFQQCGFCVAEGPDIETDYYNFGALNFPPHHPARDAQDTFFLNMAHPQEGTYLLRTHTSPVQIRVMKTVKPPIRALMPGRVYRHEAVDASHSAVFHQVEGLAVDTHITFADLKGILTLFVQRMFGSDIKLRFRPSFFPFTEPSAEIDIVCFFCKGTGCPVCKKVGWLEMLGAGMVHPNVFKAVGFNPEILSGYAFGMGVERIAMLKYGINDMRLFYENDERFLEQF